MEERGRAMILPCNRRKVIMAIETIITLSISAVGLGVSIWAIIEAKKANKAVLKQNRDKELAEIEKDLSDIDIQIARAEEKEKGKVIKVYGVSRVFYNVKTGEMIALDDKKRALLKRKQELQQQL